MAAAGYVAVAVAVVAFVDAIAIYCCCRRAPIIMGWVTDAVVVLVAVIGVAVDSDQQQN